MLSLNELINRQDPGIANIRECTAGAANDCVLLPPSAQRDGVLVQTQVTTRSTMGAIAYETGGVLVDGGWLRLPGSGHPQFSRTLPGWNEGRSKGFYLVADDVAGGFFAINGGALGPDVKNMYYWPPDSLDWEPLEIGFTDFFVWSLSKEFAQFNEPLRWPTWREDIAELSADKCFSFYPYLWTKEGSVTGSHREAVSVQEVFDLKTHLRRQLGEKTPGSKD
jgi:Protein of unknown function DUF2625